MKVALLSPKGPLYRNRGGIFKKSLRYQPLTLTTLAALAPPELDIDFTLYDEGIADISSDLDADLVGLTVITGSSMRAYELARHYRARGIAVVLGGPHVTLVPQEAQQHADAICVGYAEETWPQLLRDFAHGRMRPRYDQGHGFALTNLPFPRRDLLDKRHYLTQAVFEATRARALMELAARSGCAGLLIGFESICDSSLGDIRKRFNDPTLYRSLIDDLHALGISIQGCFVFGHDHDTTDVFDETVQFAIDAAIDLPRFAILTPFPGTPLHQRLDREGRILTKNWELYDGQHVVFRPAGMTPRELQVGHEKAWRDVYSYGSIA